jgi:hypothetical protein
MPINGFDNMSVVRKCQLISNPYVDLISGITFVKSQDSNGSQFNICLEYLPSGIELSQIKQNQIWWIERRTTLWTLFLYVGNFNPYSYLLSGNSIPWTTPENPESWFNVTYDKINTSIQSSLGSIRLDPVSGIISVPHSGIYDISASIMSTPESNGFLLIRLIQNVPMTDPTTSLSFVGTKSMGGSSTAQISISLPFTDGLSFSIQAAWLDDPLTQISTENPGTFLSVSYKGPVS